MKRLVITAMALLAAGPSLLGREQTILARVTVYWPTGGKPHVASSNGARLQNGHCAVDPKKIPFGSKVIFPDATCTAVDSGPAVISRTAARKLARTPLQREALVIDRYFETKKQALEWVAAHPHFMTLRVLDPHHNSSETATPTLNPPRRADATSGSTTDSQPARHRPITNASSASLAPADVRGGLLPIFMRTALPRS